MIDFEWAMHEHTAARFSSSLEELEIAVKHNVRSGDEVHPDETVFELLERAGLMLDQQIHSPEGGARALLTGTASAESLAHAMVRFAHEPDTGALLIDAAASPITITEVPGVNGQIIVLADDQGARQLPLEQRSIESALRQATTPSAP